MSIKKKKKKKKNWSAIFGVEVDFNSLSCQWVLSPYCQLVTCLAVSVGVNEILPFLKQSDRQRTADRQVKGHLASSRGSGYPAAELPYTTQTNTHKTTTTITTTTTTTRKVSCVYVKSTTKISDDTAYEHYINH